MPVLTLPFCIPAIGQRKTSSDTAFSPSFHSSQCLIPLNKQLSSPGLCFDIAQRCPLLMINSRYSDSDILRHEEHIGSPPILPTAMTSHSPVSSPSWDRSSVSSIESGFVPDVPTAERIPEQIGFGGMYYDHSQHSHYHHPRWEFKFPDPGHGQSVSSRSLEQSPDARVVSNPQLVGSRGEFSTRTLSKLGSDEISYTDEANSKISNRLRRRCFNCKAIETSTWRRSVLSPGKLVGHQRYLKELKSSNLFIHSYATNAGSSSARTQFHARRNFPEDGRTVQKSFDLRPRTRT